MNKFGNKSNFDMSAHIKPRLLKENTVRGDLQSKVRNIPDWHMRMAQNRSNLTKTSSPSYAELWLA